MNANTPWWRDRTLALIFVLEGIAVALSLSLVLSPWGELAGWMRWTLVTLALMLPVAVVAIAS